MPFDVGNVSFRTFYLGGDWSPDILTRFAAEAAPPVETLGAEKIRGWVSMRHLLDRDLREDNCMTAGYLCLQWMQAERKVPEALLRAHCRLEEEVELRSRGVAFLPRKVRADIRQSVLERLQPTMPPTLTGVQLVLDFRNRLLLVGTTTDKAADAVALAFRQATSVMPVPLTPETAALKRRQVNVRDLDFTVLSANPEVEAGELVLGDDFLTWLWFFWEREGGTFHLEGEPQPFGVMLEGPLLFFHEAEGAHEAVLRKGAPLLSDEAAAALWCGKKLRRTKLVLGSGDRVWTAGLDSAFSVRSLKLPKAEQTDAEGRFFDRMLALETFRHALLALFDRFLEQRGDRRRWETVAGQIRAWTRERAQRVVRNAAHRDERGA